MEWLEVILILCPQCGQEWAVQIETAVDGSVELIEDCAVCCRPSRVRVITKAGEVIETEVEAV